MKLNKRIKYLHIRIKNGVRQTHTAYRELSESEVKRVPNRYWVDDLPKPMKRIKKEVEKKKHIHRYKVYGSTAVCKCGQIKVKSSPKPTKIKCGLKHKHGYWNCCACCIQGEVKGEGAWGHVKECEFYPKIEIDEFKFAEKRYMLDLGVSREEQALADKLNEIIREINKLKLSH